MFAGTGGSGVKYMPSEHSKIMPRKCVTCHMNREEGDEVLKDGGHTFRPDSRVCLKCHEDPEPLVAEWRAKISPLLEELKAFLDKTPDKTSLVYWYARLNYDIVIADGGMGSHNPRYALALLQPPVLSASADLALPQPAVLSASADGHSYDNDSTLEFYWDSASGGVYHYIVYLYVDGVLYSETWTVDTVPTPQNPYVVPITAEHGKSYRLAVQAADADNVAGPISESSDPVVVDFTPPTTPVVTDDGDQTYNRTQLHISWTISTDTESDVTGYQYTIGTTPGGDDVRGWTSTDLVTEVTADGLSLTLSSTYYFGVRARNGAGTFSEIGISDGIEIVLSAPGKPVHP